MLLSAIFIIFGISAIVNWDISYTDLDAALVNWQMYKGNAEFIGSFLDKLIGYIPIILGVGIFFQIVGGLLVFFGVRARIGALMLAFYLIGSTLIYYPFWFYEGEQMAFNLVLTLKNLSILGGVFLLFSFKNRGRASLEVMDDDF